MKIRVLSSHPTESGTVVSFTSAIGTASPLWQGHGAGAVQGRDYDVEIAIAVPRRLGDNVRLDVTGKPPIRMNGSLVELTGTVDSVVTDGVVYIRLSPGCIFMTDMPNTELRARLNPIRSRSVVVPADSNGSLKPPDCADGEKKIRHRFQSGHRLSGNGA